MKNKEYEALFQRAKIGNLSVKNRLVLAPMGIGGEIGGCIDEDGLDYYEARAKGGAGMIIAGFQMVTNKTDPMTMGNYGVDTQLQAMGWARLADRIKGYGTAVCVQLSCGLGRSSYPIPGMVNVSASENKNFYNDEMTRALTLEEVEAIPPAFARAAARCKAVGIDAVEIHAHYGYLLDQFLTDLWNRREDKYGGSFENRTRLLVEIYDAIRNEVGPDYPVMMRMVMEHKIPGGRSVSESQEIIKMMDKKGIDGFNIDVGCYESYDWAFPTTYRGDAAMLDAAIAAREVTDKPILNCGSFTPETALKAVKEGKTDFVLLGRGMLADPEYAIKLYEGRREDVRPCIRCNEYCLGMAPGGRHQSCSVNAACAAEKQYEIKKTEKVKNVVIVGGGAAAMEAARVAALKGNNVTIYEKTDKLGGQLHSASGPEFKGQIKAFLDYQITQINKLGVNVVYNKTITADSPELESADKIIVATGASPIVPNFEKSNNTKLNVLEVTDAHTGDPSRIGEEVVIIGGGLSGCDCAIELAMEGKKVTIVEMQDRILSKALFSIAMSIYEKIAVYGINVLTSTRVLGCIEDSVKVLQDGNENLIKADTVILAVGMRSNAKVSEEIIDKYSCAVSIGDCVSIGQIGEAVRGGFFAGWAS